MGTNYFAVPKIEKEPNDPLDKIHIGKSSTGWVFIFNHNNWKHFDQSKESLEKFIDSHNLEDQFGTAFSKVHFWSLVEKKQGGMNGPDYIKNWKDHQPGIPKPSGRFKDGGMRQIFGLWFNDNTPFS